MDRIEVGQRVKYCASVRGHDSNSFIIATVRAVNERRVTIEFNLDGETVVRVVLTDRLTAL